MNNENDKKQGDNLIKKYLNKTNCDDYLNEAMRCYNEFDNNFHFFKKRKFKNCQKIDEKYTSCLVYYNSQRLVKTENFHHMENILELKKNAEKNKEERDKFRDDYLTGKLNKEDYLKLPSKTNTKLFEM
jgi:hypothetical protein